MRVPNPLMEIQIKPVKKFRIYYQCRLVKKIFIHFIPANTPNVSCSDKAFFKPGINPNYSFLMHKT